MRRVPVDMCFSARASCTLYDSVVEGATGGWAGALREGAARFFRLRPQAIGRQGCRQTTP